MSKTRRDYQDFLRRRHRPALHRRTADRWAAFLLPHLRPDMRVLDVGCGPGSITVGLIGSVVGLDREPLPIHDLPVVGADASTMPFGDGAFDAAYLNAILQHVADAPAVLREVRRVVTAGAVVGIGDADWGSRIMHPYEPLIVRGQEIQEAVRGSGNPRVGRELRGMLTAAGFERIELAGEGRVVGSTVAVRHMATFEQAWFEAPEAIAHVTESGVSDPEEMGAIVTAWSRWSADPAACATDVWFRALGWAPGAPH